MNNKRVVVNHKRPICKGCAISPTQAKQLKMARSKLFKPVLDVSKF